MVNWEYVEERRSQGWDWDRIARDPQANFRPEPLPDQPGASLRAIYYRRERDTRKGPGAEGATGPNLSRPRRWTLARIGYLLAPFFSAWFVLAYVLASPVGVYVPAIPLLGILWAVSVFLLAFGLFRVHPRWTRSYRTSLLVGSVAGLVVAGTLGAAALAQGCPVLTPNTQAAPQGWVKLPNAAWSVDDRAVALFLGSVACPYCSASSWAILAALSKVGNVSGTTLGHSTTSDVYPATPEVVLADAQLSSPWVDLDVRESTNANTITAPTTGSCTEQAYVSAYDLDSAIPFLVIGGSYAHTGTLVAPAPLAGLTPSVVLPSILNETGAAWTAVAPAAYFLMALLYTVDGGEPVALAQNPNVAADLAQLR
ncbi:MAG: DUF929 family protein [Thermoplasmata archaeon]